MTQSTKWVDAFASISTLIHQASTLYVAVMHMHALGMHVMIVSHIYYV